MNTKLERLLAAVKELKASYEGDGYHYGTTPEQAADALADLLDDWEKGNKAEEAGSVRLYYSTDGGQYGHKYRVRNPKCGSNGPWELSCDSYRADFEIVEHHHGCDDYLDYLDALSGALTLASGLGTSLDDTVPEDNRDS